MLNMYVSEWKFNVTGISSTSDPGRNKLRTYKLYKSEYDTEHYCKMILPLKHRSALARFRCWVAPLRLETGRDENIPKSECLCPYC